ncbi:MAG: GatB/YqeY domain-containing protein [Prevotellaceae bacterium]|jgi:uncharacterized protein YqeY|nr:GatB/YqeY domain-containing protein [Prevotellaceae bacterium]
MTLEEKINAEIKAATLSRDKVRLVALRAVKAAILLEKTSEKARNLDESDEVKILKKLVKQRRETAEIYQQNNREELADIELTEAKIIEEFLPQQMSAAEIEAVVQNIILETGASSIKDMGKVMGSASKLLAGKADGKLIAEKVKNLLGAI